MDQVTHICGYQLLAEKDIAPADQEQAEQTIPHFTYYDISGGQQANQIIICPQCGWQLKPFDLHRPDGSPLS